jgi:hypothetical protein
MIESSIAGDCSVSRSYSLRDATRKSAAGLRRLGSRLSSMHMAYVAPKLAPSDSRASVTLHQLGDFQGVLQRAEDASDKIHAADDRNRATLSLPLPCAATTSPSSDSTWPGSHSFATDLHRSSPTRPANRARRDGSRVAATLLRLFADTWLGFAHATAFSAPGRAPPSTVRRLTCLSDRPRRAERVIV